MLKNQYTYRPVVQSDKAMILDWFSKPHVQEFYYGDGLRNTFTNLNLYCQGIKDNGRYRFDHWLALYHQEPFAFLITSPIDGSYDPDDDYNKWYSNNQQTFTLDMLIGPEHYLGQGMAVDLIQQLLIQHFSDHNYCLIDPEVGNTKAIHVYKKAGFKELEEFIPSFNPKPHVMMRLDIRELHHLQQ